MQASESAVRPSPPRSRGLLAPLAVLLSVVFWSCGNCGQGFEVDADRSTVVVDRTEVTADGVDKATITVTVLDTKGKPVPKVTVVVEATGEGNTLTGFPATTDANGVATGTIASTRTGVKRVRATVEGTGADAGGVALSQRPEVTFVPGAAARLVFHVQPSSARAGTPITPAVQVTVRDAQDNPIPTATPNVTVALGNNPSSATLAGTTSVTASGGVATFSDLSLDRPGTGYTLVASAAGLPTITSTPFDITPGAPARLAFVDQPSSATAGQPFNPQVRVQLTDALGNVITDATDAVTISVSQPAGTPLEGQTTVDAVAGVATFPGLSITRAGTGYTLAVTASRFAGATSAPFNVVPAVASVTTSTVVANPASVVADGTATTTLTVTVRDTYGNPVPNAGVSLAVSGQDNTLTPSPAMGITGADGTFAVTLASTRAETKTVTATIMGGAFTVTTQVTFTAGAPATATSTLVAGPTSVTANGTDTTTLTVTVKDARGNPIPGQAVSLAATGSNNTFTPASGAADANGVFTATLASTTAEVKTVTATVGGITLTTEVTFTAGAANGSNSTLVANPVRLTADGAARSTIVFTLRDAQGNPVPDQAVSITVSGTNNLLSPSPATGTTNASGAFTVTLASTTAETKTLTATGPGVTLTTQVTFTADAPSGTTTTVSASPTTVVADGTSTTTVTVQARDANGNAVPGAAVSLAASGTGNAFSPSPATGTTNAAGVFTATLASTVAETKTLTATVEGVTVTTQVTFVPGAPSAATSTLVASPASVSADGTSTIALTLTVRDAQGSLVPGHGVSLSAEGSGNIFSPAPPSGTTNAAGVFTATLASTVAETKTVTASLGGGVTVSTQVTFTAGAPASGQTTVSANPTSVTADGTSTTTLTVTVRDAQGNPVPGQAVSLAASGSNNTFAPASASGTSDANGVFTATLASTTAETKTVTATAGSATATTQVTFTPGAPVAATSTLTASPNPVVANGTSASTLTATVRDAHGNVVPGVAVSFAASGSGNTLTGANGTTGPNGVATATLASTVAETKSVTATVAGFTLTTSVQFVPGPPSSATTTLVANPTTAVANSAATIALTVTVRDAQGNLVSGAPVALSASGSNNNIGPASGSSDPSGVFTATFASTTAETKTVTATAGPATVTTTVTFIPGAPTAGSSTLVASPTTVTADGSSTTTVTFTTRDANGNPVPGVAVSFTASGSGNVLSNASTTTGANGTATTTLASTVAEQKTVTVDTGTFTRSVGVTFVAGAPASGTSTLTASPTSVTANGISVSTLTLTVRDAQGNPVSGQAVSLAASGTGNTLNPSSGTTNASGIFTATLASTVAEAKVVTATAGPATVSATVTFVPGAPTSANSTVTASPTSVTANGMDTSTLTVTVRDAQGNPVPGQTVSLSVSGTGNTLSPASGTTNASGVFTATLSSTVAELKSVSVSAGAVLINTTVTFVPGAPSAANSTLSASPTTVTANGMDTATLTFTLRDVQGNAVPGQAVSFSATGAGNTLSPTSGTTNASGVFTATLSSTTAETKVVTATAGAVTLTVMVDFVPGVPSSTTSTLTASPATVVADGTATTTLTATVRDAQGNLIPGQMVSLFVSGAGNTLTPASGTTNASGVFTATLSSTFAQEKTVTGTVGTVMFNPATVTFVPGPISSATSTFTASPELLVANGSGTSTLTFTARDAQGNVIPGQAVSLAASGTGNTLTPASGTTNASGVFTATLASTVAGTKAVNATAGAVTLSVSVTFVPGAPSATASTLNVSPGTVTANGTSQASMVMTVLDANGNPIPGQSVTFAVSGTGNTFTTPVITNASGQATSTLVSTVAQAKTVTATTGAITKTTNVTFVAGPPSSAQSTLTASPTSAPANGTSTITLTATIRDANGNPVVGQSVTMGSSGSGNTFTPASGTTNASGVFTSSMTSTVSQAKTVTANVGGVITLSASVTFTSATATTYSQFFPAGTIGTGATQCTSWTNFRSQLTGVYTSITMSGTNDATGINCTGAAANQICQALRTGTSATVACGGRTWIVGGINGCGSDVELAIGDSCSCGVTYAVRPCINNNNWGGVNTATCGGPSQTMTVTCQ